MAFSIPLGFFRDVVELLFRYETTVVGSGFVERWESQGEFICVMRERLSTNASFQQQYSMFGDYEVVLIVDPGISYGNTRVVGKSGKYAGRTFELAEKPRSYGSSESTVVIAALKELTGLLAGDTTAAIESVAFPPALTGELTSNEFVGDGVTTEFMLDFTMLPSTSVVIVDSALMERDIDYYEFTDRIQFVVAPWHDQEIKVSGQAG